MAFSVPRAGTITSIAAYFSATAGLVLGLGTATVTAEIWRSPAPPDNIFTPTGVSVVFPAFTGAILAGDIVNGISPAALAVSPEDRLLLVFTVATTGLTVLTTVAGYASAGITIL
jgi:BclB C-terminal domain-containing protein